MFSYTKLRDGDWGLRFIGDEEHAPGSRVVVHTKSGAVKSETVGRRVWSGADRDNRPVSLYTIAKDEAHQSPPPPPDPDPFNGGDDWSDFQ